MKSPQLKLERVLAISTLWAFLMKAKSNQVHKDWNFDLKREKGNRILRRIITVEALGDRRAAKSSSEIFSDRPTRNRSESRRIPSPSADWSRARHRRNRRLSLSPTLREPIGDDRAGIWSAGESRRVRRRIRRRRIWGWRRRSERSICARRRRTAVAARGRASAKKAWLRLSLGKSCGEWTLEMVDLSRVLVDVLRREVWQRRS